MNRFIESSLEIFGGNNLKMSHPEPAPALSKVTGSKGQKWTTVPCRSAQMGYSPLPPAKWVRFVIFKHLFFADTAGQISGGFIWRYGWAFCSDV